MTKKKQILSVDDDLSDVFNHSPIDYEPHQLVIDRMPVVKALKIITRQMEVSGNRKRTISDYNYYVIHFSKTTKITYLDQITTDSIYLWLSSMNVSPQTKLTRLKCLKAFLSRCFDNGWIEIKFWKKINIKVDKHVKQGATEKDINILLSVLDLNDFVQLRDATAVLIMFKTGLRINTLSQLENKHIDFNNKLLRLDGSLMKNHDELLLPFDDVLNRLLTVLLKQNDKIRKEYKENNSYVFITKQGKEIASSISNNNIQKRLYKYANDFGLKNINPHALRRGFAKSLLNKGARITDISRALGHSNLAVTTQYLHLDKEEVAENLRKFL